MNILSLDTATKTLALALCSEGDVLEHRQRKVKYNHGSSLLGAIQDVLEHQTLSIQELSLIVVGLGPGSFTGLRVGMATAKGLARAANIDIVGVSTLASLAFQTAHLFPGTPVCAAVDAHRGQIYAGVFILDEDGALQPLLSESAWKPTELVDALLELRAQHDVLHFVGRDLDRYQPLTMLPEADINVLPPHRALPDAVALAFLGEARFRTHGADDLHALEPNYIRASDAEINWAKKHGAQS